MAIIIGSLALLVSFVALWLVSSSMKKIEDIGTTFLKRVQIDQRKITDELNAKIARLEQQNLSMAKQLKHLTEKNEGDDHSVE